MTDKEPSGLTELRRDFGDRWDIRPCWILGGDYLTARRDSYTMTCEGAPRMREAIEGYEAALESW